MDELFLHYIWKYQKFESLPLKLSDGQELCVFYPGNHNQDSGPDFEEARIKVDSIEWAGQVEIHIRSSDWIRHNHQSDRAYESVILHVVWKHDQMIHINNTPIPTLELNSFVDPLLISKYERYIESNDQILCNSQIKSVSQLKVIGMMDRVLIERLSEKSLRILKEVKSHANDWELITYITIATNFGFATNKDAFRRLAELLPFHKLKKLLQSHQSTEALLFGQAGFLEDVVNPYQHSLKDEYDFQKKKLGLSPPLLKSQWKFGKLRPANFPSVRIAQLASILHHNPKLFIFLIETKNIKEIKNQLQVSTSEYWQSHYDFGKPSKNRDSKIGTSSLDNILINSAAPLLAAYSTHVGDHSFLAQAVEMLESIAPESNRITKKWDHMGIKPKSAFDSQALIQLYQSYCQQRKCLLCNIGVEILNK